MLARRKKLQFFLDRTPKTAHVLDFGCAESWFKQVAAARGIHDVVGLDLAPPADIVGDIFQFRALGLQPHSFDIIVAFEVLEHGDFSLVLWELLKPDGRLFATTPVPRSDGVCRALERLGLLQRRTSAHSNLTDLRRLPHFAVVERRVKGGISQWGVLRPLPA